MKKLLKTAIFAVGASIVLSGCVAVVESRHPAIISGPVSSTYVSYSYPYYYDRPYYYISGVYYYGGYYRNGYYYYNGRKLRGGHYYNNRYRYYNGRRYRAVEGSYGYYTNKRSYERSRAYRERRTTKTRTRSQDTSNREGKILDRDYRR